MPNIALTKELSRYPLLIRMVVEETDLELALGSGFIYEYEEFYYLITNGHNITGVNPETNTRISKHAAFPTLIKTSVRVKAKIEDHVQGYYVHWETPRVDIYNDGDTTRPLWYIHPEHGYQVDVVAIPVAPKATWPDHILVDPINLYSAFILEPEVGDDVYVLGYPFGITDSLHLPIWKRGSIATEPAIPYKGLPKMLIDTATRPGMSGAPVILMRSGVHNMYGGKVSSDTTIGTAFGFVGVYSGRIGAKEENEAQLGIVWRKQVIEEILAAKVLGTTDFQNI